MYSYPSLSGRSSRSHGMDHSIYLKSCPSALLTCLPSVIIKFKRILTIWPSCWTSQWSTLLMTLCYLDQISQKYKHRLEAWIRHTCFRGFYKDSGPCHTSEVFWGLVVSSMLGPPLQSKGQIIPSCTFYHSGGSIMPDRPLGFGGSILHTWEYCFTLYQVTRKSASFKWVSEQERAPQQFKL